MILRTESGKKQNTIFLLNFLTLLSLYQILAFFIAPPYIPDSEDSGDVPAPVSSLSLHMRWLFVPEPVGFSAVCCPLLHTEGVCKVTSEAKHDSDSPCGFQSTASSRPGDEKCGQSQSTDAPRFSLRHVMKSVSGVELTCELAGVDWGLHLLNSAELMLFSHHLHDARPDTRHRGFCCSRGREES